MYIQPKNRYNNKCNFKGAKFYQDFDQKMLKEQILRCRSVKECAEKYDEFISEAKRINYQRSLNATRAIQFGSLISMSLMSIFGIVTSNPVARFIAGTIGVAGFVAN